MKNLSVKKKAIVMGKGSLGIKVAQWFLGSCDYELTWIVPVIPEPEWTDSIGEWAGRNDIPCISSGRYQDIPQVQEEAFSADLVISVFYDKIIKPWFISKCKRVLNIHNSVLPKYRGIAPINWALKNGEREHGVTIHEITADIDSGPIISQIKYSLYPEFDEVIDVYQRALEYGWVLFQQTMPMLDKIEPQLQDESLKSYYTLENKDLLAERKSFAKKESLDK